MHDGDHGVRPSQISDVPATVAIIDRWQTGAINIVKHVEGPVAGADHSFTDPSRLITRSAHNAITSASVLWLQRSS